jgi:hypothetical protein
LSIRYLYYSNGVQDKPVQANSSNLSTITAQEKEVFPGAEKSGKKKPLKEGLDKFSVCPDSQVWGGMLSLTSLVRLYPNMTTVFKIAELENPASSFGDIVT